MFDKMKQIMELQKRAKEMQKGLDGLRVEKKSRDGKITIVLNGNFKAESVSIDPTLLSPAHRETLEKTLGELIGDAAEDVKQKSAAQAMDMMKGMDLKLPGM